MGTQKNRLRETVPLCTQMTKFNRIWMLFFCRFNNQQTVYFYYYIYDIYLFIHLLNSCFYLFIFKIFFGGGGGFGGKG